MIFVNFRHVFITLMFLAGALTLLLGYNGMTGMLLSEKPAAVGGRSVDGPLKPDTGTDINGGKMLSQPEQPTVQSSGAKESFYVEYRLQREKARSQQVEILKDIANSPSSTPDSVKAAQEQLLNISRSVSRESRVENLLKAKGCKEAVACVDQKGVTVVVDSRGLNASEEGKLADIVSRETGFGEQSIIIIPRD